MFCRVQSLFDSLGEEKTGKSIGLGGDGRYFNKEAAQKIIKLAAANGIKKVIESQGWSPLACLRVVTWLMQYIDA